MKTFCFVATAIVLLVICPRARTADAPAGPTFNKDIAPILFSNCTVCHRPDEIGPFSLVSYNDAKKHAKQIIEVTGTRLMPPWKPQPGHGEFLDSRRLSDEQIANLKKWLDGGAPEGNAADLPALPNFPKDWELGKPDMILKMDQPVTIPAEGNDIYVQFVFPMSLPNDVYLKGVEVRPGNRRIAHHAMGMLDSSGTARKMAAKNNGPVFGSLNPGFFPSAVTPGYVPGQTQRFFPPDTAITMKKGTDFVLQMHYHPSGKVETDQTIVGLYFAEKKVRDPVGIVLGSQLIDIPAGKRDYTITDSFTVPVDLEVRDIWAHMHMVGKQVTAWAELPDGTKKLLLKIDDWDFNWQDNYRYTKPFTLPKGTRVFAEFIYDNSSDNPHNPNNPPKRVEYGERSIDEMAGLIISGVASSWEDEVALLAANIAHYVKIEGSYRAKQAFKSWLPSNSR